jgi:hypothetical protein
MMTEQKLRETPEDGSAPYLGSDSTFLHKHLSWMDLSILDQQWLEGTRPTNLTESEVVDLFL